MYKLHIDDYFSSNDDRFSIYTSNPEDNNKEHCHEFDELVLVESGHGLHVINGKPCYIQEGDVFYVNTGDFHFYDELGTLKLTNILINKSKELKFLKNMDTILHNLKKNNSEQPGWLQPENRYKIIDTAKHLASLRHEQEAIISTAYQEMLFFQVVIDLTTSIQNISKNHTKYKIYQLMHWLQDHCFDDINWNEAEKNFLLTRRTIFRQIKEMTGMTPESFLKRLRLISARSKLRETDLSVTEISFMCGFSSSNHFSTCYKDVFGYSPKEERVKEFI